LDQGLWSPPILAKAQQLFAAHGVDDFQVQQGEQQSKQVPLPLFAPLPSSCHHPYWPRRSSCLQYMVWRTFRCRKVGSGVDPPPFTHTHTNHPPTPCPSPSPPPGSPPILAKAQQLFAVHGVEDLQQSPSRESSAPLNLSPPPGDAQQGQ
jgi:hypothetical protein